MSHSIVVQLTRYTQTRLISLFTILKELAFVRPLLFKMNATWQSGTAQQQKHCTDTAAPHSHRRLHLHAIYTYKLYQVYNVEAVASLVNGRSFFCSCCYCCCRRYTSTTCTTSTGLCVLLFYEIPSPADVMRRNKQLFLKQTNNNNRSSAFLCVVACESFCLMNEKRHQ